MPFINTKTTAEITPEKELILKNEFGKAISFLGKSETWLMLNFEDNQKMYFQGKNDSPIAIAEISLFGRASSSAYDKMTSAVTEVLSSQLGISPSNVYVKYDEVDTWGWNGHNF